MTSTFRSCETRDCSMSDVGLSHEEETDAIN